MKQLAKHSSIVPVEFLNDRAPTGIKGLDELIEWGLPRTSLVILAGSPGSGKTIASAQFLYHGATKYGENGVYASFAERKDVFIKNVRRFGLDFTKLEKTGKFKFLDFATTKETGMTATLEVLVKEVLSIKSERLVIDSFSAMALAFENKIDARIVLHTFEKIMRQANCTTLLLVEVPTGSHNLGLGFEEFVADGLILFETIEDNVGIRKRAIVRKMRGTNHNQNYCNIVISDEGLSLMPYVT